MPGRLFDSVLSDRLPPLGVTCLMSCGLAVAEPVGGPIDAVVVAGDAAARALAAQNTTAEPVPARSPEWLPGDAEDWELEWNDEFEGAAGDETNPNVDRWYPMLGWAPEDFKTNDHKGLRWTGDPETSAWFTSTEVGNHWLDGQGSLVLRAAVDKAGAPNAHGPRVETAYLMTGLPEDWDPDPAHDVRWAPGEGVFVSPTVDGEERPLYISARIRTDQVLGDSTWFAFWLFSQTRSYNNHPADGTEVDVVEVVAGRGEHFDNLLNVANHWNPSAPNKAGSEDKYYSVHTTPTSTELVDFADGNYHTFGIEWTHTSMTCSVDGKPYYTFTEHVPTDPVDMMLMLTLEFKPNLWHPTQGDGRAQGPFVSDTPELREMSRVLVDYVRVYRQK